MAVHSENPQNITRELDSIRVKKFIRNVTEEIRLNSLALLSVHRNINRDPKDLLNKFTLQKIEQLY